MAHLADCVAEFSLPSEFEIERVVVAAELEINMNRLFEGAKYVEFLSSTFEKVHALPQYEDRVYIIPDGTSQTFEERISEISLSLVPFNFIEKSKFLEENQNG